MMLLTGVKYDAVTHTVYVAASISGKALVYSLKEGSFKLVTRRQVLVLSKGGMINDVAIGADHIYFSDSIKPYIYAIPRLIQTGQTPGVISHYLGLQFIGVPMVPVLEGANGLVEISPEVLAVANYKEGELYLLQLDGAKRLNKLLVDQHTGSEGLMQGVLQEQTQVTKLQLVWEVGGKKVWPDGLIMDPTNESTLYVADNFNNRLLKVHLNLDAGQGRATAHVQCVIKSQAFSTPSTLAVQNGMLWAVNARFLDCVFFLPCTWQQYEMVGMQLNDLCS